jgi:hypothetical protein
MTRKIILTKDVNGDNPRHDRRRSSARFSGGCPSSGGLTADCFGSISPA